MIPDLSKFGITIIYNSPYSPTFSPIEEFCDSLKKKIENTHLKSSYELMREILIQINTIDLILVIKLYIHSFVRMLLVI